MTWRSLLCNHGHRPAHAGLPAVLVAVVASILAMTVLVVQGVDQSSQVQPGDEPMYYGRAASLAHGDGYTIDTPGGREPTAYGPVLWPVVQAGVYSIAGPSPTIGRWLNTILMAAAVGLAVSLAFGSFGRWPALIVFGVAMVHPATHRYADSLLTEPLAALLMMLVVAAIYVRRPVVSGVMIGLLALCRSIYLPAAPLFAGLIALRERSWRAGAVALVMALLVYAPWAVRNCYVTGRFMPTGTQGWYVLSGGYCDISAFTDGDCRWTESQRAQANVTAPPGIQREVVLSDNGKALTLGWLKHNWPVMDQVAGRRLWSHWQPRGVIDLALKALAVIGCIVTWRMPFMRLVIGVLVIDAILIAAIYSAHGRFLFPVMPLLWCMAAVGLCAAARIIHTEVRHGQW